MASAQERQGHGTWHRAALRGHHCPIHGTAGPEEIPEEKCECLNGINAQRYKRNTIPVPKARQKLLGLRS